MLAATLAKATRLRAWVESREAEIGPQLASRSGRGDIALVDGGRMSMREARTVLRRGKTLTRVPVFASAFVDGRVTGAHVDAVGIAMRRVEREQRDALARRVDALVGVAAAETPDDFSRRLDAEVQRLRDDDGVDRFRQQQLDMSLRTWVDQASGMYKIRGQFDPVSGAKLSNRLDALMAELFADKTPDTCPSDPLAKQDHLRALALVALCEGKGGRAGRPEFTVVIDTHVVDERGRPAVDWGLPIEVPESVLRELADEADVAAVVVRAGAVIHAPGTLDLGRTTRLASRAQRRVLRALYPTCAIEGCGVRFSHTKAHHVWFWEHGGPTDLDNLLPLCSRHHTAVHDGGWMLKLLPDRTLTVTFADGSTMTTGPPKRAP